MGFQIPEFTKENGPGAGDNVPQARGGGVPGWRRGEKRRAAKKWRGEFALRDGKNSEESGARGLGLPGGQGQINDYWKPHPTETWKNQLLPCPGSGSFQHDDGLGHVQNVGVDGG